MIEPVNSPGRVPAPTAPQLAIRVAILGGIAFALFAIIFFRLWFLQVLSGEDYRQQALDNRVRTIAVPAPRGKILDRNGRVLVENRVATVIQLDPRRLPASERVAAATWGQQMTARSKRPKGHRGEPVPIPAPTTPELAARLSRLAGVLGVAPRRVQEKIIQQLAVLPYANVRVKVEVPETHAQLPAGATARLPRHRRGAGLPAPLPARVDRRAARRRRSSRSAHSSWGPTPTATCARARCRPGGPRDARTTATCAATTASRASPSTPPAGPGRGASRARRGPATSCARPWTWGCRRPGRRRWRT